MGDYEINYDWSYDLLENTQETFSQLIQGLNNNVVQEFELRQFLFPSEDIEESKKVVEEIREIKEPDIESIIGNDKEVAEWR